jgi:ATP-dependent RNA helicase DHX37/DHR1
LRKDENLELMKKLALAKVDLSEFRSIKNLSKKEKVHTDITIATPQAAEAGLSGDESDELETGLSERNAAAPDIVEPIAPVQVGSGLKRPLELGEDGFPVLKKRKRTRKAKPVIKELPWEGFDSGDEEAEEDEDDESDPEDASEDITSQSESEHSTSDEDDEDDEEEDDDEDDEEEDDDDDEDQDDDEGEATGLRTRNSAFKSWATNRINEAVGFKPSADQPLSEQHALSAK